MFVVHNCTFTPGPGQFDTVVVPGVYSADQFQSITNITRNSVLYVTSPEHDGTITVTDDGVQTTIIVYPGVRGAAPTDDLQVICYNDAPGTSPGPAANVAVTNWPASQNINGAVTVNGEVEVKNDTGNPLAVSGTVSVGNFPATQPVSGSVSVSNFPATQTVDGSVTVSGTVDVGNFPATQTVDGSVSVSNFPTTQPVSGSVSVSGSVDVNNFPATQTVDGSVSVSNFPASTTVAGTVDVGNFPATTTVDGSVSVSNFPSTQPVSGSVSVSNFPATQAVTGTFFQATQPVSGSVSVSNFPATQAVTGTFFQTTQPVSGTVTANQGTSPWVVSSTGGSTNISSFPTTSTDAFGRLRVSEPFTMFDSSFRYGDNQLWSQATATGGTGIYNAAQGLMDLNVTTTSGSSVQRQTTKVFAYQPGKSLLVMTTFVCAAPKANLDQKVGYYNSENGYFLEQDGLTTYFVERSAVSGAVTNTRVAQSAWNVDPMDGTGPSGITLDISKAQILWMDLEWLGVGTVKMGFVINGSFYICHTWDHANLITSTYITTASLPLSCEITNTGTTASASTFKQICATVISEGGYALTGLQQSVGTPVTTAKTLAVAGTYYPIVSLRLKTTRLDAIAVLTAIAIQGTGNNNVFRWEVRAAGTTTAGAWTSAGANSSVEYNLTGTGYTGGRILAAGFTSSSNQGTPSINILKEALFANQLERDIFTATPYELTIVVAGATGGTSCYASMDWEEVSR
jgi:hypothetical protein